MIKQTWMQYWMQWVDQHSRKNFTDIILPCKITLHPLQSIWFLFTAVKMRLSCIKVLRQPVHISYSSDRSTGLTR